MLQRIFSLSVRGEKNMPFEDALADVVKTVFSVNLAQVTVAALALYVLHYVAGRLGWKSTEK